MAKHLYILSEGELDEMFYERLAERVTGQVFQSDQEFRLRLGSNWKSAMANARLLISRFKHWTAKQDIAVIIAVDNDRAPGHPGGRVYQPPLFKADQRKEPRYTKLAEMLKTSLGEDRAAWPVDVSLAVPVEIIESWVLTLLDPNRDELPAFSEAESHSARNYHEGKPPPQLKDICKQEAKAGNQSMDELFWKAAESDLAPAVEAAPSLKLFVDELKAWT